MKAYWFRVAIAFLLLKLASSVMKQAEDMLGTNMNHKVTVHRPTADEAVILEDHNG